MCRKMLRISAILCCLLCCIPAAFAQYKVTGGNKTPLLAYDNTRHRIQVYLVYGLSGVEISYTSASSSHQWYRYKTTALNAERVNSRQNGTTSAISSGIEDGYGYYVEESGAMKTYIWIIDYSQYVFDINTLDIAETNNPCSSFRLTGDGNVSPLVYFTPNGEQASLARTFEVSYKTMEWSDSQKRFSQQDITRTVDGNPFNISYPAPLCDTDIRLTGDSFAKHFDVSKTIQVDDYAAVALEVHADTLMLADESLNMSMTDGELSAPATITFKAYANEPVAALYIWKIYQIIPGSEENKMLFRYTSDELEYTFREAGEYYAELEVSDRSATCTNTSNNFSFIVSDYFIDIPNVFSPGSTPGINDEFRVVYRSIYNFKGWIFNRWGVEMFKWTDPSQGWDGKKGGKYVAPGVYYYIIEFEGSDGKKHKRSGDINILRPKTER